MGTIIDNHSDNDRSRYRGAVCTDNLSVGHWPPEQKSDNVNRPSHYTRGKIEVIDFIEDQKLCYHIGNAVKYCARAGYKDPSKEVKDLEKAIWYIKRKIEKLNGKDSNETGN